MAGASPSSPAGVSSFPAPAFFSPAGTFRPPPPLLRVRPPCPGRAHQRGVGQDPVLPEEVPVADVLDFGKRKPLAMDRGGDQVAFSPAPAKQDVLRYRTRREVAVDGPLVARQLSLQDLPRPDDGAPESTRRLGGARQRRGEQTAAVRRGGAAVWRGAVNPTGAAAV